MMMIIIITVMVMVGCIFFFVFVFAILSNCVCFWYCRDTKFLSCSFICSLVRVLPFRSLKKHSIQFNSLSYTHSVNDNNQYRLGVVQFNSNSRNRNDTMMMMMMMNRVFVCLAYWKNEIIFFDIIFRTQIYMKIKQGKQMKKID